MKTLRNIGITAAAILLSGNTFAAKPLSDGQLLGQCKNLAKGQFEDVKKVKMTNMKSTRGTFKAKFRVTSKNDKGMFLCTIESGQDADMVRLDTQSSKIAAAK